MRGNNYGKQQRENKRLLAGLESRYEKDTAHVRRYTRDCAAIEQLLQAGDIDRADAYELRAEAKRYFDEAQRKIRDKRRVRANKEFVERNHGYGVLICLAIVIAAFTFLKYQFGS